jgi:hypothetical protein
VRREEEDNYEAEEVKEEDSATRGTSARRLRETGQFKTQTAASGDGKSVESCEEISRPSDCVSRKQISGAKNRGEENEQCQENQEKTESFTGAPRAARSRDESQVGCEESCRGKQHNLVGSKFSNAANAATRKQRRRSLGTVAVACIDSDGTQKCRVVFA